MTVLYCDFNIVGYRTIFTINQYGRYLVVIQTWLVCKLLQAFHRLFYLRDGDLWTGLVHLGNKRIKIAATNSGVDFVAMLSPEAKGKLLEQLLLEGSTDSPLYQQLLEQARVPGKVKSTSDEEKEDSETETSTTSKEEVDGKQDELEAFKLKAKKKKRRI